MGLINTLFGNASEVNADALMKEFGPMLCPGETIEKAYVLLRDRWVFTSKRLIVQDVQGVTGKKREYMSIPYRSVERFSLETAGTFDMDSDLKIWIRGSMAPLERKLGKSIDVMELQRVLATYVL